ncbi:hypothetical protein [Saccharothrix deserti]|uniref:hypothetical protein n=1 Tax=Saccharothrix deserti TaxID=2593674 RepID=UPI00131CADC0|nr:hypothetical protein [Saccharothrix deserti]
MVKKVALTLGALALAFGSAVLVTPAAHADSSASTTGAEATFTSDGEIFRLYDTKCDGNPVYLVYKLRGGSENRMDFSGGCDKSAKYDKDFAENSRVEYKACVNINNAVDKCSGWSTDTA